jgi:putative transposase
LAEVLERHWWGKPQVVAADLHEQPYHGQAQSDPAEVRRGKAKSGTTHFHSFATAFVIRHGKPLTLALHFVRAGESLAEVLEALKRRLDDLQIQVELWMADKAFCSVEALAWLDRRPLPYVPLVARGRNNPSSPMQALLQSRASRWARHTLRNSAGRSLSFDVAVVRRPAERSRGSDRTLPAVTLLYAVVGEQIRASGVRGRSPQAVYGLYRKRFGIETSYRQLEQGRLRTTSRSPVLRLLAVGLALLLANLWALCRWICSARPGPGRRKIQGGFQLKKLLRWITHVVNVKLHYQELIELPAPSAQRF